MNSEDVPEITTKEINSALQEMKNNKAPGMDYITKELLKDDGRRNSADSEDYIQQMPRRGKGGI